MNKEQLKLILQEGEGQFIEFKEKEVLKRIGSTKGGYWKIKNE